MIFIDQSYDVVLTYSPIIEITGHIFECFDYYLFLKHNNYKVGILFFSGLHIDKLKIAWESKYNINFSYVKNDLILSTSPMHNGEKVFYKFGDKTVVILTDGNYPALDYYNIILVTRRLLAFRCQDFSNTPPIFHKQLIYLQDNRVYNKDNYFQTINYIKKIPIEYYKKANRIKQNVGMMYVTYVCRKVTSDIILKYHKLSGCDSTILIVPFVINEYNNIPNVTQVVAPVRDLFNQFDIYIYTPIQRQFDCSPRLITECFFQNKQVIKQLDYYDIGLETRYNDCVNNLQSLELKKDDDILKIIEKMRSV